MMPTIAQPLVPFVHPGQRTGPRLLRGGKVVRAVPSGVLTARPIRLVREHDAVGELIVRLFPARHLVSWPRVEVPRGADYRARYRGASDPSSVVVARARTRIVDILRGLGGGA